MIAQSFGSISRDDTFTPMHDTLHLTGLAWETLAEEAARARPAECCGLLAGRGMRVEMVLPVPNVAETPESRYEIAPAELWAARRRAERARLDVVGFYHSHPRTAPVPSSYDIERAYYPEAVYVIVALAPRPEVRAYRIARGRVLEVEVVRELI